MREGVFKRRMSAVDTPTFQVLRAGGCAIPPNINTSVRWAGFLAHHFPASKSVPLLKLESEKGGGKEIRRNR